MTISKYSKSIILLFSQANRLPIVRIHRKRKLSKKAQAKKKFSTIHSEDEESEWKSSISSIPDDTKNKNNKPNRFGLKEVEKSVFSSSDEDRSNLFSPIDFKKDGLEYQNSMEELSYAV